jgi:hypothetical protein
MIRISRKENLPFILESKGYTDVNLKKRGDNGVPGRWIACTKILR